MVLQLKLLQPDQYHSQNVRDSPQAVGVRVSMSIRDCCGLNSNTPLPREWLADCATAPEPGPPPGMKTWPTGIEFILPFWPELDEGVPGLALFCPWKK